MIYGFTAIGAAVSIHHCSAEQKLTHHHNSKSSTCSHQAAHQTADCCTGGVETCAAKSEDTVTEPLYFKSFQFQPVFAGSNYLNETVDPFATLYTKQRIATLSFRLHKLRLHLYNRILLI